MRGLSSDENSNQMTSFRVSMDSGSTESIIFVSNRLNPSDSFWGRLKAQVNSVKIIDTNHERQRITDACAGLAGTGLRGFRGCRTFREMGTVRHPNRGNCYITGPHESHTQSRCGVSVAHLGGPVWRKDSAHRDSWLMDWLQ